MWGNEFEGNSAWIGLGLRSLKHLRLPYWQPEHDTGIPYLGDPFSNLFSPLTLIPGLMLGPLDGPRVAIALTVIASGLTMYYLASVLGLGMIGRLVASVAFMLNGHMLVRFGGGHFDFAIAFPYIPLVFATLIQALWSGSARMAVCAAVALTLLLFAGDVYYVVFAIPGLAIATAYYLFDGAHWPPKWRLPAVLKRRIGVLALIAVLAIGLSAIQLWPWLATRPLIGKQPDPQLLGSPTIAGSLHALFDSDRDYFESQADDIRPGYLHEYYSYVGLLVGVGALISPLALFGPRRKAFLACASLSFFYLLWASAAHTPAKLAL